MTVRSASGTPEYVFTRDTTPEDVYTGNRTDSCNTETSTLNNPRDSITSVTSLEASELEDIARRNSAVVKLPPLSRERGTSHGKTEREGSDDSVTSARKVNVDMKRSPMPGRNRRVGDFAS